MYIFGLGNPGTRYAATRHNAGAFAVDTAARFLAVPLKKKLFAPVTGGRALIDGRELVFVLPRTYMNRSGTAVRHVVVGPIDPQELLVVCDTLDLPPGVCRLKRGGGDAGHKGLKSVISETGSSDFLRLYIGIGRPAHGTSVVEHVLGSPEPEEIPSYFRGCSRAAEAILRMTTTAAEEIMNELNRKKSTR